MNSTRMYGVSRENTFSWDNECSVRDDYIFSKIQIKTRYRFNGDNYLGF